MDVPELKTSEPDLISCTASYADSHTFPFLVSTAGLPTASALLGTECNGDLSTIVDFDLAT